MRHAPAPKPPRILTAALRAVAREPCRGPLHEVALAEARASRSVGAYVDALLPLVEARPLVEAAWLHRQLAEVYERDLNDLDGAARHHQWAVQLVPDDLQTLAHLVRLHEARGDALGQARALEQLARWAPERERKLEALRAAARLYEKSLSDLGAAEGCWLRLGRQDGSDAEAASALERLSLALDHPETLAFALDLRRGQEAGSPAALESTLRLAVLQAERLGNLERARSLLDEVLRASPWHPGALLQLEELAVAPGEEGRAALELLDRALSRVGDPGRRVDVRRERMTAVDPAERLALLGEIRELYALELGDPRRAFEVGVEALALAPERPEGLVEAERLARAAGALEELAEGVERQLDQAEETDAWLQGHLRWAGRVREELGEAERAARHWNDLLALVPEDREALSRLSRLYAKTQDFARLAWVLEREAALTEAAPLKQALLLRAASSHEAAGNGQAAVSCAERAVELGRGPEVLAALERLLLANGKHREHASLLGDLAARAQGEERVALLLSRARSLERASRPSDAAVAYAEVLAAASSHAEAMAGLRRLLTVEAGRAAALEALEPVYRQSGDLPSLVELLELRFEHGLHAAPEVFLSELASLEEQLGRRRDAFHARLRLFSLVPGDLANLSRLRALAAEVGADEELVAAFEDRLERGADDGLAVSLWRWVAEDRAGRQRDAQGALAAWEEAFALMPSDPALREALLTACEQAEAYRRKSELLWLQAEAAPDGPERAAWLEQVAALAQSRLADPVLAARANEELLRLHPTDRARVAELLKLREALRQHQALAGLLRLEAKLAVEQGDAPAALEAKVRLAVLEREHLADPEEAFTVLEEVLRAQPDHPVAGALLESLAEEAGPVSDAALSLLDELAVDRADGRARMARVLEAQLLVAGDPETRGALLLRVAGLREKEGELELAFLAASRALREHPASAAALERTVKLGEAAGELGAVGALLESLAASSAAPQTRATLSRRLALLWEDGGELARAAERWREVLHASPGNAEALDALERLHRQGSDWRAWAEVLRERLPLARSEEERLAVTLRLARAQEGSGELLAAVQTLKDASRLRVSPEALKAQARLLELLGNHPERARVLGELAQASEADRSATMLRQVGALIQAADFPGATRVLEAFFAEFPDDPALVPLLQQVLRSTSRPGRAALLLTKVERWQAEARRDSLGRTQQSAPAR